MRPPLLTSLHRLAAVTTLAMVAIGAVGFSPAARAKTPSQTSYTVSIEVTKSSIVNAHGTAEADYMDSSYCDADLIATNFDSSVDVQADLDSANKVCTFSITNMSITQFNDYFNGNIEHDNGSFTYTSDPFAYDSVEVSVTFPGKVSRVSGDGTRSGNTATWKHAEDETKTIEAVGADHGTPYLIIGLAVLVVLAIAGGLSYYLLVVRKKQQPAYAGAPMMAPGMAPGYAQPGQPGAQQPVYTQPVYTQPGQAAPNYLQPGQAAPAPPPDYTQPGQPPYNPNGQY